MGKKLNIGNVFKNIGKDIKKGFEQKIIVNTNNIIKNPNKIAVHIKDGFNKNINKDHLQTSVGYLASIVQTVPIIGPIAVIASTAIADKFSNNGASKYLDRNQNSTISMIPFMNLAQRIAHDSSNGKSSDFLKNQFLDPKKEIMDNLKSGNVFKPINLTPQWVKKELPIFADISNKITSNSINKILEKVPNLSLKNNIDIYKDKDMHRFSTEYRTYPNMLDSRQVHRHSMIQNPNQTTNPFVEMINRSQIKDRDTSIRKDVVSDKNVSFPVSEKNSSFFVNKKEQLPLPVDKTIEKNEKMKDDKKFDNKMNDFYLPISIGVLILFVVLKK